MTSTKTNLTPDKSPGPKPNRRKRLPSPPHSVQAKVQAILAVWTDRIKPAEVCRQLQINWVTFQQWQNRALEGMLQALESRVNLAQGQVLSPRLQQLLAHKLRASAPAKLPGRLEQIQNQLAERPPQSQAP